MWTAISGAARGIGVVLVIVAIVRLSDAYAAHDELQRILNSAERRSPYYASSLHNEQEWRLHQRTDDGVMEGAPLLLLGIPFVVQRIRPAAGGAQPGGLATAPHHATRQPTVGDEHAP